MTNPPDTPHTALLHPGPPLEMKFVGSAADEGTISGLVSAYGPPADTYGDVIQKGSFDQTLAEHQRQGSMPSLLWCHDLARPVGKWTSFNSNDYGLHAVGKLNLETDAGREAFAHLKAGDVASLSIGYMVRSDGYQYQQDGTRLLTKVDLVEASIVPVGACRRARITSIKSLQTQRDLERWLHDEAGLSRAAAVKLASGGWSALTGTKDDEAALAEMAHKVDAALAEIRSLDFPNSYR